MLRVITPIVQVIVTEQVIAGSCTQTRALERFEDLDVVAHIRFVRRTSEELARDERMRFVHARIELRIHFHKGGDEAMPRHIAAHETGAYLPPRWGSENWRRAVI